MQIDSSQVEPQQGNKGIRVGDFLSLSNVFFAYIATQAVTPTISYIYIAGTILMTPIVTRNLFSLAGRPAPKLLGRFLMVIGVVVIVNLFPKPQQPVQASAPATAATPSPTPAPTSTPKPAPTPTATPKPAPSAKPKASATPKAKAEDVALVDRPYKFWAKAGKKERMWTASILTYELFKEKTQDKRLLATAAEQLFDCLNSVNPGVIDESPVSHAAAWCALKLGWANED